MIDTSVLVAIACMIANKGTIDTSSIEAQLTLEQKAQVQQYISNGTCDDFGLPESAEGRLESTQQAVKSGKLMQSDSAGEPTRDTF